LNGVGKQEVTRCMLEGRIKITTPSPS